MGMEPNSYQYIWTIAKIQGQIYFILFCSSTYFPLLILWEWFFSLRGTICTFWQWVSHSEVQNSWSCSSREWIQNCSKISRSLGIFFGVFLCGLSVLTCLIFFFSAKNSHLQRMEALAQPCAIPYSSSFILLFLKKLSSSFLKLTGKAKSVVQEERQKRNFFVLMLY